MDRNRRRFLHRGLAMAGAGVLASCDFPRRQQATPEQVYRIGWLGPGQGSFWRTTPQMEAFRLGLRDWATTKAAISTSCIAMPMTS